uniref:NADH-ubiquinone oxidoreductase chain 2 n=1 Tax=Chrysomelidae sp. SOIL MMG Contig15 TaxID=2834637 RepID=A0A8F4WFB8_9CUCU|nr:NADH dehydrogenase subunit 2 [Chrysomelidae sp. SOIL MMG Contig15]
MMKSFKIMFFMSMIMGSMITISSNSWMGMWIGLEINLLSVIPLLSENSQTNSTESSIKYFITQVTASNIMLMAIMTMIFYNDQINFSHSMIMMIQSALFIKMGAAPFHSWFPEVMEGLSWLNCLIILTWQKIAPMIIFLTTIKQEMFIFLIIVLSSSIGSIMGFNQISLRKIMAYSSINHIGWMLAAMMGTKSIWFLYFCIYTLISINVVWIFHLMNVKTIAQISNLFNSKFSGLLFSMNFLSLGGLPPFLGFLPKWLVIQQLIYMNVYSITLLMILMTLIAMFFYARMALIPMTLANNLCKMKFSNKVNFIIYSTNFISLFSLAASGFMINPF